MKPAVLAVFIVSLTSFLPAIRAAAPSVHPLPSGKWVSASEQNIRDAKVAGHHAYLCLGPVGLAVVNVSDPTNCVRLNGYATPGSAVGVALAGNYAYVADGAAGLQIIDISDPTNCVRAGGCATDWPVHGLALAGNFAYMAYGDQGMLVIGITNQTNCGVVAHWPNSYTFALAVAGNRAYVQDYNDRASILDVSNLANIRRLGAFPVPDGIVGLEASGDHLFVRTGQPELQVYNVSDPTNSVLVATHSNIYVNVCFEGSRWYVAGRLGVQAFDLNDPTNTVPLGTASTLPLGVTDLAVSENRIYAACLYQQAGERGLLVLPALRDFQFTLRVGATPGVPFTIEAAGDLGTPMPWAPIFTTNVATLPFDFVDFDVRLTNWPRKFYRVRQP